MADEEQQSHKEQPIIVKKIKKGGHGHHGGAWKVAYADFVTAMMAFFIVMWILAASNEATKAAIQEYFNNPGAFNIFTGEKIPVKKSDPINLILDGAEGKRKGGDGEEGKIGWNQVGFVGSAVDMDQYEGKAKIVMISEEDMEKLEKAKQDSINFAKQVEKVNLEITKNIKELLSQRPDLNEILSSIKIEMTKEGLRIELIESEDALFFEVGSAKLKSDAKEILRKLAEEISKLPNYVEIEGHTDSRSYGKNSNYTNWDLSADRANSARRIIEDFLWSGQIQQVAGFADTRLRNPENPFDTSNRRVSIMVKNITVKSIMESSSTATGTDTNIED